MLEPGVCVACYEKCDALRTAARDRILPLRNDGLRDEALEPFSLLKQQAEILADLVTLQEWGVIHGAQVSGSGIAVMTESKTSFKRMTWREARAFARERLRKPAQSATGTGQGAKQQA